MTTSSTDHQPTTSQQRSPSFDDLQTFLLNYHKNPRLPSGATASEGLNVEGRTLRSIPDHNTHALMAHLYEKGTYTAEEIFYLLESKTGWEIDSITAAVYYDINSHNVRVLTDHLTKLSCDPVTQSQRLQPTTFLPYIHMLHRLGWIDSDETLPEHSLTSLSIACDLLPDVYATLRTKKASGTDLFITVAPYIIESYVARGYVALYDAVDADADAARVGDQLIEDVLRTLLALNKEGSATADIAKDLDYFFKSLYKGQPEYTSMGAALWGIASWVGKIPTLVSAIQLSDQYAQAINQTLQSLTLDDYNDPLVPALLNALGGNKSFEVSNLRTFWATLNQSHPFRDLTTEEKELTVVLAATLDDISDTDSLLALRNTLRTVPPTTKEHQ